MLIRLKQIQCFISVLFHHVRRALQLERLVSVFLCVRISFSLSHTRACIQPVAHYEIKLK